MIATILGLALIGGSGLCLGRAMMTAPEPVVSAVFALCALALAGCGLVVLTLF